MLCHYAECHVLFNPTSAFMVTVVMLSVIILNVIMLSVVAPNLTKNFFLDGANFWRQTGYPATGNGIHLVTRRGGLASRTQGALRFYKRNYFRFNNCSLLMTPRQSA